MHQIQLSDQLFEQIQRKAATAGCLSVDEYIVAVLQHDLSGDPVDEIAWDAQLAAEWTEELDRRIAAMRAGTDEGIDPATVLANIRQQLAAGRDARDK